MHWLILVQNNHMGTKIPNINIRFSFGQLIYYPSFELINITKPPKMQCRLSRQRTSVEHSEDQ